MNSFTSSSSPNDSNSSEDQQADHVNNIAGTTMMMPMHNDIHDIMTSTIHMDSSCSSSTSMQATTTAAAGNYQFDPFSMLDYSGGHDMCHADSLVSLMPSCLAQVGNMGSSSSEGGGGGVFDHIINLGDYGVLEAAGKMGHQYLEKDHLFSLPQLESTRSNIEENNMASVDTVKGSSSTTISYNNNHFMNNSTTTTATCFNMADNFKGEGILGFGNNGQYHQQGENLKMGEWDLEGLMQDISSFPFLDFQV